MNIVYRKADIRDKDFIINGNKEINILSGLNDSILEEIIDKDLFKEESCKAIIAEIDNEQVGFVLYSYIYWANRGKGIYLSQAYVKDKYRKQGLLRAMLEELGKQEKEVRFITNLVGNENEIMIKAMNKLGFESSDLITFYKMK